MVETPKFCVDCAHFFPDASNTEYSRCQRTTKLDLITGKTSIQNHFCIVQREYETECGPKAKYFEPKPPTPEQLAIANTINIEGKVHENRKRPLLYMWHRFTSLL